MTALSLTAVGCLNWKSGIAFSANFLVAVEFLSDGSDSRVHNSSSQSEHQVKSGLFLDVIVGQASSI